MLEGKTQIGLGYSNLADAFQSGREAAQMAKSELPSAPFNLVLALGPSNPHFQDFIEGVRLVTGEEALIGIPTQHVFTNDFISPDAFVVLILQSNSHRFSISASNMNSSNLLSGVTSLFTDFRRIRGNIRHQFEYHGILYFDNQDEKNKSAVIASEAGLDSWLMGIFPKTNLPTAMICHDMPVSEGTVAIECLSHDPWGIGTVNLSSFIDQPRIIHEAATTAVRDAVHQLNGQQAACCFIFLDFSLDKVSPSDFKGILHMEDPLMKNVPILGLSTSQQSFRSLNRPMMKTTESLVALVIPQ